MSKAEIIAELAQLSSEELADVRAWLDRRARDNSPMSVAVKSTPPRIRSPHLAAWEQRADFVKQVLELPADAML
jgi:hypothetical protein